MGEAPCIQRHCKQQCVIQLKKDASVPLAKQEDNKSLPMDLKTYTCLLEFVTKKQNDTYRVNLGDYCYYLNAEFTIFTLMFGGPRGSTELAERLFITSFVRLESNLLHFLQSGITKGNQTGGDANFNVKGKPDLYFLHDWLYDFFISNKYKFLFSTAHQPSSLKNISQHEKCNSAYHCFCYARRIIGTNNTTAIVQNNR